MTNGELSIELTRLCGDNCIATDDESKAVAMRRFAAFAARATKAGALALAGEARRYEEELRAELYQARERRAASCTVNTPR